MTKVHGVLAAFALLVLPACALAQPAPMPAERVDQDVREWQDWLFSTHPHPGFSMDVAAVEAAFDQVRTSLDGTYSRREAWLALAVLNPLFADGHVTIRLPGEDFDAYLAEGGADFTLPVRIADGQLRVAETVAIDSPFRPGERITTINGVAADTIVTASLARTNGDTPGLRAHLVETRFSRYLWAVTGGADRWRVGVLAEDGSAGTQALDPQRDRADHEPQRWALAFQDDAAILTLNTFIPTLEAEFTAFIDNAFAEIAAHGIRILVIDLSENGGGAHPLSDHLLAYLTDRRHTPLSAVTARITPENQALIPGSQVGDVISAPYTQWVEPPAELANRFSGKVAVLVGAGTYSQAIVLAATVQDFDIAPVAGPGTEGRANSTGQVQLHRLANTDLEVAAPIYVFTRASGDTSSAPVVPDIQLSGSRQAQIAALITRLRED